MTIRCKECGEMMTDNMYVYLNMELEMLHSDICWTCKDKEDNNDRQECS